MKSNAELILDKFQKELPEEYNAYITNGEDVLEALSTRALEYIDAFETNARREEEITGLEKEGKRVAVADYIKKNPVKGGIGAAMLGFSSGQMIPTETIADLAESAVTDKTYQDLVKERQMMKDVAWEESPWAYGSGKAAGMVSELPAQTKIFNALKVGKLINTANLAGKSKWGARAINAGKLGVQGGVQAGLAQPGEGEDSLRQRLEQSGYGAALAGIGVPLAAKGIEKGLELGSYVTRGIPADLTKRALRGGADFFKKNVYGRPLLSDVSASLDSMVENAGRDIETSLIKAEKEGRLVSMKPAIEAIDKRIQEVDAVMTGADPADVPALKVAREKLVSLKEEFLQKIEHYITDAGGIQEGGYVKRTFEAVDPEQQTFAKQQRWADAEQSVRDARNRTSAPEVPATGNENLSMPRDMSKESIGTFGPTGKTRPVTQDAMDTVDMTPVVKREAWTMETPPRDYVVPSEIPGVTKSRPGQVLQNLRPTAADVLNRELKSRLRLFQAQSGNNQKTAAEQIWGAIQGEIKKVAKLPYTEELGNFGDSKTMYKEILNKTKIAGKAIFGKENIDIGSATSQEIEDAVNRIVKDKGGNVFNDLVDTFGREDALNIVDTAKEVAASRVYGPNGYAPVKDYFKNRLMWMLGGSLIGGAVGGAQGGWRGAAVGAGALGLAGAASPLTVRSFSKLIRQPIMNGATISKVVKAYPYSTGSAWMAKKLTQKDEEQ